MTKVGRAATNGCRASDVSLDAIRMKADPKHMIVTNTERFQVLEDYVQLRMPPNCHPSCCRIVV